MDRSRLKVKSFEIPKRLVYEAWEKVRANQGAPGVDAVTIAEFQERERDNLYRIWNRMSSGSYFPGPERAVEIPKDHGLGMRTLGVPNTVDRVAQTAAAMLLEEKLEPIFHPDSYGYRPRRSAHDALAVAQNRCWKQDWILDLDIRAFLKSSTHCSLLGLFGSKQLILGCRRLNTQALSPSGAEMHRVQLAALYTLHDRLSRDPVRERRLEHGEPSLRRVIDEERPDRGSEADPPGRARRELLTTEEAVTEPAVQGRGCDAEFLGGAGDREQLAFFLLGGGAVPGDIEVVAQRLHTSRGERESSSDCPVLAVQDAGDFVIGVVHRQAVQQSDRVLVGADRGRLSLQGDGEIARGTALPAKDDVGLSAVLIPPDGDVHLFEQAAQKLLALLVGCARCVEDSTQVVAQGEDGSSFICRERLRSCRLPAGELPLGPRELGLPHFDGQDYAAWARLRATSVPRLSYSAGEMLPSELCRRARL